MGDSLDSPSSLFGDGGHATEEDVWSPSLRSDIFWHNNATTRDSPSPNHLDTDTSVPQYSFNDPSAPLNQLLNTFPNPRFPVQPTDPAQGFSHSTPNTQAESQSSRGNNVLEPFPPTISPISWNVLSSDSESSDHQINTSESRHRRRPASPVHHPSTPQRTSSDFVDLTEETDTPPRTRMPSASSHLGSHKRRRLESNPSAPSPRGNQRRKIESQRAIPPAVEEVDLRDVDDDQGLSKVLEDQRMATIKAQQEQASRPVKLATLSCVICMEPMTDVTATYCGMPSTPHTVFQCLRLHANLHSSGHLFCHKCLMEALIAGENQGSEPGKGPSKCPVCRKKIKRPGTGKREAGQVVSLEIKVKRRNDKGKGKERRGSTKSPKGTSTRKGPVLPDSWD